MNSFRTRHWVKLLLLTISVLALVTLSVGTYLYFKPHRNVDREKASEAISVSELTRQFHENPAQANAKYLADDGNSSVLEIAGEVQGVIRNMRGATVIVLSQPQAVAQVRCTMSSNFDTLHPVRKGSALRIKGAITAGNGYDSILQLQHDATLVDCSIVPPHKP